MEEFEEAEIFTDKASTDRGFFSIVASYSIRSNSHYNVAVSVHKASEPHEIKITLKGPNSEESKQVEVPPMTTQYVGFELGTLLEGDYKLLAEGIKGNEFSLSRPLKLQEPSSMVFIQTDKATYKPSDLVQFRVLFMDDNTRPLDLEKPVTISIIDGQKNRLKQWKDVEIKNGVFVEKYQLSDEPLLGDWQIDVTSEGQTMKTKDFEVDKYVLPKFTVSVESEKDVAIFDGIINATVRSQYTYGKAVKGKATVSIKPQYQYYYEPDEIKLIKAEKTIDVDGKGHVQFKIGEDFTVQSSYNTSMEILAVMEEELTGNQIEASAIVELHSQRFQFEGIDLPYDFQPGKPLTMKFCIKKLDDTPVLDTKNPVKLIIEEQPSYYHDSEETAVEKKVMAELTSHLDDKGIATFEYTFSEEAKQFYYVKCEFLECKEHLTSLRIYEKPEPMEEIEEEPLLLALNLKTENPKLGEDVELEVMSREPIPYIIFTIHSHGRLLKTECIVLPEDTKSHLLVFKPTFDMVPCASVFVHYVVGEDLRYEDTTISFEREFENFIDITAPTEAQPSEDVNIQVKSHPGSYIGLLGVDQSVLLLKSGNDLNSDHIFDCLQTYDNSTAWRNRFARCPGDNSGLVTITNAKYPVYRMPRICMYSAAHREGIYYFNSPVRLGPELAYCEEEVSRDMQCDNSVQQPEIKIRKEFPENWIFEDIESMNGNSLTLHKTVPDTITSWVITGFSLSKEKGFAVTNNPATIKTFRPFFIGTNLPYAVKRGEKIAIPVLVFNYMDQDFEVKVTFDNADGEFDFTKPDQGDQSKQVKQLKVPANSGESVSFEICPKQIGQLMLKITAVSPLAGDAIHKELKVEPEGIRIFKNRDFYLHSEDSMVDVTNTIKLDIPHDVVPDSESIEVTVMGNILGSTISNIDNLVRMPCGCGEQIMVNFVPNILILWYLESIQELTTVIEQKAKRFLEIGYQRELTYKHDDGSYSAFGKSDSSGSTWLTAYVIRCFHQAKKYIDIDTKILEEGLQFLAKTQAADGSFPEVGRVLDSSHLNLVGLTAFVLLAFLENTEYMEQHSLTIERGFTYLQENIRTTEDLYALSIALYALQQRKLEVVHELLAKLEALARIDGGLKWWTKEDEKKKPAEKLWYVESHDVEITGYILMTLLDMDMSVMPITRWLISQRNSNGGYGSTQETVVGLWSLIKFAEKNGAVNPDMNIKISTPSDQLAKDFHVKKENSLVIQSVKLPKLTREITFAGKGSGTAIIQISYHYNIVEKDEKPSFKLSTKAKPKIVPARLNLDVFAEFVPAVCPPAENSNMVVMEIGLPSGYAALEESLAKIKEIENVKRVETKDCDTCIVVYFDRLRVSEVKCVPVEAELLHSVNAQKPAPIVIYDYYENQRKAVDFYEI